LLGLDSLSSSDEPSIPSAQQFLNETINSGDFYVDMSGFTGKKDKFEAVKNSLVDYYELYVEPGIVYNVTVVQTGISNGQLVAYNIVGIISAIFACIVGNFLYIKKYK